MDGDKTEELVGWGEPSWLRTCCCGVLMRGARGIGGDGQRVGNIDRNRAFRGMQCLGTTKSRLCPAEWEWRNQLGWRDGVSRNGEASWTTGHFWGC